MYLSSTIQDIAYLITKQGHSHSPFSPLQPPPRFPPNLEAQTRGYPSQSSGVSIPMVFQGLANEITPTYAPSFRSNNSWAPTYNSTSRESFAPSSIPQSATVPPLFTQTHGANNFVPPPPRSYNDFQPSSAPAPPGLLHLENTLHYHIDACFERLSRLVTDKNDRIMDEVIRRCEALDERIEKGLTGLQKGEFTDIKKELDRMKASLRTSAKASDELKKNVRTIEERLEKLDKKIEENGCKCRSTHESLGDYGASSIPKHPTSHRDSDFPQHSSARRHRSGNSVPHPTNVSYQPGNTSTGRRSNTMSGAVGQRGSQDREGRREYFAAMGRDMGPEPDLNQHPAYVGAYQQLQPQAQDLGNGPVAIGPQIGTTGSDNVFYHSPQYSGGAWYDQAYGRI